VLSKDDKDLPKVLEILKSGTKDTKLDKAMGCFYGMVIGDAIGAPLEFSSVRYGSDELKGFDVQIWKKPGYNSFGLKPGQWTDDASMGLCIAESLIACRGFNAFDLRLRFQNWWEMGYCNAFGNDEGRGGSSVGLGGNISLSLSEFKKLKTEYTTAGDKMTSGNGSVMRMSAVPVYFHDDLEKAMEFSCKQSKTTHQGDEAAECCRLMSFLMFHSFQSDKFGKEILDLSSNFQTEIYSVDCLANSKQEERHPSNEKLKLEDRNWNWKDPNFRFSTNRSVQQPGYIGSYCMDALSMALHCVYSTDSFESACLKCANLRGDSDSVCSVTAQIAGAVYGLRSIPKEWIQVVSQWDNLLVGLRAFKLFTKNPPNVQNDNQNNQSDN